MADSRIPDSATAAAALDATHGATRAAAALALGQVRARHWVPRLRDLLADADSAVAANAAFALGLMRDTASVAVLVATLSRGPAEAREAAWALSQIGEPAAGTIARALTEGVLPEEVLGELLLSASRLRPVPAASVAAHLGHQSPEVRWRAAYAFARGYTPAGVRHLLALSADPSGRVRSFVARGLAHPASGDSLAQPALDALRTLARDSHPQVRVNALRALATHGPSARAAILIAVRDPDANVRIAAAEALGPVLDATASWDDLWAADTGFTFRRTLLASAVRAGVDLPALREWRGRDWRHRSALAQAAAASREEERRWRLALPMAGDPDERVRAAALTALAALGGDTVPRVRRLLLERATQGAVYERAAALGALADHPRAEEASRIAAAFERALADTVGDARTAAASHLAKVWREDSLRIDPADRARVRALPEPAMDPVTRAAVGGQPPFEGWRTAPGTARPLGWYEERVRELVLPALGGLLPRAAIETERGVIVVELFAADAPLTVHNFLVLARAGLYDGLDFHRVVPNFVAQDGDPTGAGPGGPAHVIRDELNRRRYERGTMGMALSGPDTGGSQYFLTHSPQPHLDGGYTVFGRVIEGLGVLDAIVQGDRIETILIR